MLKKLTGLAIAAGLAGALMLSAGSASAERLVFMTGPAGGSRYPLGAAYKNMVETEVFGRTVDLRTSGRLHHHPATLEGQACQGMGPHIRTAEGGTGKQALATLTEGNVH